MHAPTSTLPIRPRPVLHQPAEIRSPERLAAWAQALAARHEATAEAPQERSLRPRLDAAARLLARVHAALAAGPAGGAAGSDMPGATWLLDNYYIITAQITEIRVDLPQGFYVQLPKLVSGALAGYPRVYGLGRAMVAATDSALDPDRVIGFVAAYQEGLGPAGPLTLGELWSVPIMLRLSLVETLAHLVHLASRVAEQTDEADAAADAVLNAGDAASQEATPVPPALAARPDVTDPAFAARLYGRLRDQGRVADTLLTWLGDQLAEAGTNPDDIMRREHRQQTDLVASIGNTISAMRQVAAMDWPTFVEGLSVTEARLRRDPAGIYSLLDFPTRDRYRHQVEWLARRSGRPEPDIAAAALGRAATAAREHGAVDRRAHVGYYLIDAGLGTMITGVGARLRPTEKLARLLEAHPTPLYLGLLAATTGAGIAGTVALARRYGADRAALAGTAVATALPASNLAVSAVNYLITTVLAPQLLPKLNLKDAIPAEARTVVAIPVLLSRVAQVREVLEQLEVRYLANNDPHLHYALLSDYGDADSEDEPGDATLLHDVRSGVEELNARYGGDRFYLFHRRRRWNPAEGRWMGWERKRGKLLEFNRLLRGQGGQDFVLRIGDMAPLQLVRYVITLDADTQLPPGTAHRLVGTIHHPLNRPECGPDGRVVRGHGILQPRVGVTATSATLSPFARILSGHTGVDPYTTAVSDVYQDLFHTGIYIGKGIYDVDAFEAAVGTRFPENTLLSHDLLEGAYARAALVSDIVLYEDQPARYGIYALRDDRWVRGDWQILGWLGPWVRDAYSRRVRNPLPLLARWQIFDNLRRSAEPFGALGLVVAGWTVLPGPSAAWTLIGALVRGFPLLTQVGYGLLHKPPATPWHRHLSFLLYESRITAAHMGLTTVLLPYRTLKRAKAIGVTLWRMAVSRRHLLEWQTAADAQRTTGNTLRDYWVRMWPALGLAGMGAVINARYRRDALAWVSLAGWALSPLMAYWVSQPERDPCRPLTAPEQEFLRLAARRTWRYFETFIGPADNWLAPDNYQEVPVGTIARRTSPTNLSLALLASGAARHFGYLSTGELATRLDQQLAAIERLERFRGHLYNWYDTTAGAPLQPRYVSTVDSGNLAGHLMVLKQACLAWATKPVFGPELLAGLADTAALLAAALPSGAPAASALASFQGTLATVPGSLAGWTRSLALLTQQAADVAEAVPPGAPATSAGEAAYWAAALRAQTQAWRADWERLFGWLPLLETAPPGVTSLVAALESTSNARVPSPAEALTLCAGLIPQVRALRQSLRNADLSDAERTAAGDWAEAVRVQVYSAWTASEALTHRLHDLARRATNLADGMDFPFLYDNGRKAFAIGYNVTENRRDASYYDMLASEARLGSYLAIARGDVPTEHWFHLSRALATAGSSQALVSWTGTMFEYLMPNLVMPSYSGTLLDQTAKAVVARHQAYAAEHHVPWGISEAAYNLIDAGKTYQYRAFGVPGLGLKRGLEDDLVVAPYATMLAAAIDPPAAVANLRRLAAAGALGAYGYYESLDYTPGRTGAVIAGPPAVVRAPGVHGAERDTRGALVRTYMVHHQGMSLLALSNVLHGNPFPAYFEAEPMFQAADLLLQERIPRQAPRIAATSTSDEDRRLGRMPAAPGPPDEQAITFGAPNTAVPMAHLLSNGTYSVVLTNAAGGWSQWRPDAATLPILVTRWRDDATRDNWGTFCYVREVRGERFWMAGHAPHPPGPAASDYSGTWNAEQAIYRRSEDGIETRLQVVVSPDEDVEVRRVTLTNTTGRPREIEVTSYAEIVLTPAAADLGHPAFQKLFVETEFVASPAALLATRRPRAPHETPPWLMHTVAVLGETRGELEYETDRARFLGRGRGPDSPAALDPEAALGGHTGAVLDPVISLRRRVRLAPGETARVTFATGVAATREGALALAERYAQPAGGSRAIRLAGTYARILFESHGLTPGSALRALRLAGRVVFPDPALRPPAELLARNTLGQPGLWAYGISGDLPIVLVVLDEPGQVGLVQEVVQAHGYWSALGFRSDLVILNSYSEGYNQAVHDGLAALLGRGAAAGELGKPGGVFLLRGGGLPEPDLILLRTAARVVLLGRRGSLARQLQRATAPVSGPLHREVVPSYSDGNGSGNGRHLAPAAAAVRPLAFRNGIGGFAADGREYVIGLPDGTWTPAPWTNVLANSEFGALVSESSLGTTWSLNSRENRLTPWSNDPVSDPPTDAIYLRDARNGALWTPTPLPIRDEAPYEVRHGFGYTVWTHTTEAITSELTVFVPPDQPVRVAHLVLSNGGPHAVQLAATHYVEWLLGVSREPSARFVITNWDAAAAVLTARNPYNNEFASRVAFLAADMPVSSYSADRATFLGRNGSPAAPAALVGSAALDGRSGAGLDPCGALQVTLNIPAGGSTTVRFFLGEAPDAASVLELVATARATDMSERTVAFWRNLLNTVQVATPDPALDLLLNGWLLYQALACRIWARSAFYQGGGAFGFRDQLQDVLALVHAAPTLVREQIVRAAARQFREGDVQHWWHPPTGRGVRTRFSDDLLWLPYVTALYVAATGDTGVLDETQPFLEAPVLAPGQEDSYSQPAVSAEQGTVYEHCVRALEHGTTAGAHGLPLMGAGDWNDGMNRVGIEGHGESVWVAWFLASTLDHFAPLAAARGDAAREVWCREHIAALAQAVDANAWDGEWYKRAYFDDGTPLGSRTNDECRIDSIAQSWAVIAGIGDPARAEQAMAAVQQQLVRPEDKMILLFAPPFDKGELQPGYIKGYLPGVRENGGQYTHAAIWTAWARAVLRDGAGAHALFRLLNPIAHAADPESRDRYKVEPYVIAADIYAHPAHLGRGGWTWYTGSASWMYRLGLEAILGLRRGGGTWYLDPTIPPEWPGFRITLRAGEVTYLIEVINGGAGHGITSMQLDGSPVDGGRLPGDLAPGEHTVVVHLGGAAGAAADEAAAG
ncbi:MAG TPA: glucoamylase family protein [Chloroflexia bacterium]|nr:glucoamylase family protein [Chloroflexia bacterium]